VELVEVAVVDAPVVGPLVALVLVAPPWALEEVVLVALVAPPAPDE
jgi:hypothetical protein